MSYPSFPAASSSSASQALPWDLQRSLDALLAGRSTLNGSGSSPLSSSTVDDDADEREHAFHRPYGTYRESSGPSAAGMGGKGKGVMGVGEEGDDGLRTPFGGRATLQVPFFRWCESSLLLSISGRCGDDGWSGSGEATGYSPQRRRSRREESVSSASSSST